LSRSSTWYGFSGGARSPAGSSLPSAWRRVRKSWMAAASAGVAGRAVEGSVWMPGLRTLPGVGPQRKT
jgi:hypothetical protein